MCLGDFIERFSTDFIGLGIRMKDRLAAQLLRMHQDSEEVVRELPEVPEEVVGELQ